MCYTDGVFLLYRHFPHTSKNMYTQKTINPRGKGEVVVLTHTALEKTEHYASTKVGQNL